MSGRGSWFLKIPPEADTIWILAEILISKWEISWLTDQLDVNKSFLTWWHPRALKAEIAEVVAKENVTYLNCFGFPLDLDNGPNHSQPQNHL